jgi:hypothetical protein
MPTLLTWCPGKSPPEKCDQCACKVTDPIYNAQGQPPYNLEAHYSLPLGRIETCSPSFAAELWQDQSAFGGASLTWITSLIGATDPLKGASATMTFYYPVPLVGGGHEYVTLMTLIGATVLVPDGSSVPPQWKPTQMFQAVYDSNGAFVKNILYYTEWGGAPSDFIWNRAGNDMYGFLYDGPLTTENPQVFIMKYTAIGGGVYGLPHSEFFAIPG